MTDTANAVTWFEIPATDLARATAFYEVVLGVRLRQLDEGGVKMAWWPQHEGAPGSSGGLIEGRPTGNVGTVVYLVVPDMDAALARVEACGGRVVMPKKGGDHGAVAQFEDSEGNLVAFYSHPR